MQTQQHVPTVEPKHTETFSGCHLPESPNCVLRRRHLDTEQGHVQGQETMSNFQVRCARADRVSTSPLSLRKCGKSVQTTSVTDATHVSGVESGNCAKRSHHPVKSSNPVLFRRHRHRASVCRRPPEASQQKNSKCHRRLTQLVPTVGPSIALDTKHVRDVITRRSSEPVLLSRGRHRTSDCPISGPEMMSTCQVPTARATSMRVHLHEMKKSKSSVARRVNTYPLSSHKC